MVRKRKRPLRRDRRGRFVSSKRKRLGYRRAPKARGLMGLETIRLPEEEISRAFAKFTRPLSPTKSRPVYAFVEVSASYGGISLREGATAVLPVTIGRLTRGQVAELSRADLAERLRLALPGTEVLRIAGFGHGLLPEERRGKRFKRGKARVTIRNRKARKKSTKRRN